MEHASKNCDALIIGGGPAAMSAGVWCADLGLRALVVERSAGLGGQLSWIHNPISNYLGVDAPNGAALARRLIEHFERSRVEVRLDTQISSVDLASRTAIAGDRTFTGDSMIIATGVRRRKLGVKGEEAFSRAGILSSGMRDRELARGKRVAVVGGGDAALENALILSDVAAHVYLIHRRERFSARGEFVSRLCAKGNVSQILNSQVTAIEGTGLVEGLSITSGGQATTIDCDAVLIRVGVQPNSDLFLGQLETDASGYISVDKECRTSAPGVWAIGDVTGGKALTIARAVGEGSIAAKSIVALR